MIKKEVKTLFRPNWHPRLQQILGDIIGAYGYVTQFGTIELLGPIWDNPDISKNTLKPDISGPTLIFAAPSGGLL
jgi:hypothetical protein